jgi:GMP synthase (glutamine-hydrolysing)
MPIVVLQHAASDPIGRLGPVLRDHALKLDIRRLDLAGSGARSAEQTSVPVDLDGVDGVISLGGPMNVGDDTPWMQAELALIRAAHARQLPVLGICLGAQLVASALGGEVGAGTPEFGFCEIKQTPPGNTDRILAGVPWTARVFQAHAQEVKKLPEGATILQSSAACRVQCFSVGLRTYGFQYHFECDKPGIDTFLADRWSQELMAKLGLGPGDVQRQRDEHDDAYTRLGKRISTNIASFMFPLR